MCRVEKGTAIMTKRIQSAIALSLFLLFPVVSLVAQEKPTESDQAPILELIKQLASPNFAERQAASLKLTKFGEKAIPRLTTAALGKNREVVTRSVGILKSHLKSTNEKLKAAASGALKQIVAADEGVGSRLAAEALAPPKPVPPPAFPKRGIRAIPQIQLQIKGQAGAKGITIRDLNGVRDIEVKEKDRSIKIHDDPNKGIQIQITETKDGKQVIKKYEAKNAEELKKKHPEAHKIYQQYAKGVGAQIKFGNIQIQGVPRIQIAPFKIPNNQAIPRQLPANGQRIADIRLQQMERMIQSIQKQLEPGEGDEASPAKKAIEHLKRALEEIKQAREKLKN